ncbi:hypothetical protein P154DRAFT_394602, partial [Amniculicola lignicola CBS 123094]
PSSRGVANLTPEQLARKRANDREAQRAIRERTRNQIERLNQRIQDLESQQPYHDLQVVLREKDAIQAENADIRKRLEGIMALIQPVLRSAGGLNGLPAPSAPATRRLTTSSAELAAAAERSPLPPLHPTSHPAEPRALHTAFHSADSPPNGVHSPAGTEPGRPWLYPADAPTSNIRRWSGESPRFDAARPPNPNSDMPFDERLGVDFLLDNSQRRVDPNLPLPHPPSTHPPFGQHAPHMAPYLILPRSLAATCPLDAIMLDFLADRHARASEGVAVKTLVGPTYPNFTALVYPDRLVDAHPLSKLFTDILKTFPDICGLPEQVAVVFIMFLLMRWQIEPTQENYDRLPDWVTPRASQLFVPHPCWVDHLPWPRLRDRIIATHPFTPFDTFFIPFTTTLSLNWRYEPRDCLLPASLIASQASNLSHPSPHPSLSASSPYSTAVNANSPPPPITPQPLGALAGQWRDSKEDDQWLINPAFESHLRDLRNWSLGPSFRSVFPSFADSVRIRE